MLKQIISFQVELLPLSLNFVQTVAYNTSHLRVESADNLLSLGDA